MGKIASSSMRKFSHQTDGSLFSMLNIVQLKRYIGAILFGLLVFACCIFFSSGKQYTVSMTAIVNIPGAMPNGHALRLSETDTSKVNPYNRLKQDIHDLQEFQYNPAYQNHSLSIEPGTRFYNSLELSLDALSFSEGKELLYRLINLHNSSFRKKRVGQQYSSDTLSNQLEQVSHQLLFLQNFSSSVHDQRKLRRAAETLTALSHYVAQPVSQFSLIPNTYIVDDKRITALILAFNELQNKKQHFISYDKRNADELSLLNKQLSTLQSELTESINDSQLMINRLLSDVGSGKNKAYIKLNDSLLITYAKLIQIKANSNSTTPERLIVVDKLQITDNHWPLIKAITVSLIAAVMLFVVLVISSQIGSDNKNSIFNHQNKVNKGPITELLTTAVNRASTTSDGALTEAIASAIRQKGFNSNVFMFTTFAGVHDQLNIELAVADILSSQNKTVVLVNTDFSESTTISGWMEPNSVGVKNFIADEAVAVDLLPQISTTNENISSISLGGLHVNGFADRQTEFAVVPFINSNPDTFIHHPRLKQLIDILRPKYDYILLHASPLTNPADVLPFSTAADHTMLLVQKGGFTASASSKVNAWIVAGSLNDVSLFEV
jgi:Mrp family chromosome partitioning ATPase